MYSRLKVISTIEEAIEEAIEKGHYLFFFFLCFFLGGKYPLPIIVVLPSFPACLKLIIARNGKEDQVEVKSWPVILC